MGIPYVEGQVKGPAGKSETGNFLIDSGATYSLLPQAVWIPSDCSPNGRYPFHSPKGQRLREWFRKPT